MKRLAFCFGLLAAAAIGFAQPSPTVAVIIDPVRGALVRWPLPEGAFPPGGFQLEASVDGEPPRVVAVVKPGSAEGVPGLLPAKKEFADRYLAAAAQVQGGGDEAAQARLAAELVALADPAVAAYLGLSHEDRAIGTGSSVTYTVRALGANGRPERVHGVSPPTPMVTLPPPPPPTDFRAVAAREGIGLYWSAASKAERNPAIGVTFEIRKRDGRSWMPLTPEPVLRISADATGDDPAGTIDHSPKPEETAAYTITAIDLFGRRGPESAPVEIFYPDFTALDPPVAIAASTGDGKAMLAWEAPPNRNRKGWSVVRSLQPNAAGEPVAAQPISGSSFVDPTVVVGTTYYYRISAVNQRGEQGEPKVSQAILVRGGRAPAPPVDLAAELKTGRILLSWTPSRDDVAGYQVERSIDGGQWGLLTSVVSAEPKLEDLYSQDAGGTFRYRVVAWSYDDTPSAPSEVLSVPLPDTHPPLSPIVTSIDGSGGKVTIRLAPRGGASDAAAFYILRSETYRDPGSVQNPERPMAALESEWTDLAVDAGRTYFYRAVSVDAAGNRSEPTEPSVVRVGVPSLPAPPRPALRFKAAPFPHVEVEFSPSGSPSVLYALQRREPNGMWLTIQGPFPPNTTSVIDASPPKREAITYRLVTVGSDGTPGPKSEEATVATPKR
jgi:hypothetical protein